MATPVKQLREEPRVSQRVSTLKPSAVDGTERLVESAWVCPLVKTLCARISEAPGPETCRDCAIYRTWHLADHVDHRFWY
jgi:hypothetical protein